MWGIFEMNSCCKIFSYYLILILLFVLPLYSFSNNLFSDKDSLIVHNYKLIPLPVFSYNSDVGFTGGIISNYYYYGSKRKYFPDYKAFLYGEATYSTKGSGILRIISDYKNIIPGIRLTNDIGYFTEKTLPFWGFNEYSVKYSNFPNLKHNYFKVKRQMYYAKFGAYTSLFKYFSIFAAFTFNKIKIQPKSNNSLLKDLINWKIINDKDSYGGYNNFFTVAFTYDTRKPVAANPDKGIFIETNINYAPAKINDRTKNYLRSFITIKGFISLIKDRLLLASRGVISKKLIGYIPYYAIPFYYTTLRWYDAVGGIKTIRGMDRDRLAVSDYILTNTELRFFTNRFNLLSSSASFVFYPYIDVLRPMVKKNMPTASHSDLFLMDKINRFLFSYGGGMGLVFNYNLVLNFTIGVPDDKNFGKLGIFAGLDYVF